MRRVYRYQKAMEQRRAYWAAVTVEAVRMAVAHRMVGLNQGCPFPPGSDWKLALMTLRCEHELDLFHPGDATELSPATPDPRMMELLESWLRNRPMIDRVSKSRCQKPSGSGLHQPSAGCQTDCHKPPPEKSKTH